MRARRAWPSSGYETMTHIPAAHVTTARETRTESRAASVSAPSTGELRTLHHERVLANWEAAVLRPLRPDLFVHVSALSTICAAWDPSVPLVVRNRREGCTRVEGALSPAALRELADWLESRGLVQLLVRSERAVVDTYERPPHGERAPPFDEHASALQAMRAAAAEQLASARSPPRADCYANAVRYSLALRWFGCLRGMQRAEEALRGGVPYGWVVRARPDYTWDCTLLPPPRALDPCGRHAVSEGDFVWIAPRALAGALLSLARFFTLEHVRTLRASSADALTWTLPGRACRRVSSCHERSACFDAAALLVGGIAHSTCVTRQSHAPATPADTALCVDGGLSARASPSGLPRARSPFATPPAGARGKRAHTATNGTAERWCYAELRPPCLASAPAESCWVRRATVYGALLRASAPGGSPADLLPARWLRAHNLRSDADGAAALCLVA
ncbi:hypothetical protein KFE25_012233 [Diacronema lutheri]|uniref:Uncharacterized protein n=1 Tax=Diacronema lutheri TaxID=2081491 RepID=A0A8J6CCE4_DIALT|nr:hypothetical protein KFE25_012233 [Diacronema lutheri]